MPTFVRTPRAEAALSKAKASAAARGLSPSLDPDRYWAYVKSAYQGLTRTQTSMSATRLLAETLKKSAAGGAFKVNSGSAKAGEGPEPFEPKGSFNDIKPQALVDGHAMVQRPDHPKPITGRVLSVGTHGIHLRSDDGKVHKVRHEHVLDHRAPIGEEDQEFPEAATALHQEGIPMSVEDRFRKPSAQKGQQGIPQGAAELLQMLEDNGVPIDTKRLLSEGSPEDIEQTLSKYVNLDPKPSSLPTVAGKGRIKEAPDWQTVFPEGQGRVSRQSRPPEREYADDTDGARDEAFDGITETKMVSRVDLGRELEPEDEEHVLRVAYNVLKALADVIDPVEDPPILVIGPRHPDDLEGEDVGAHFGRHGNRLEIGMGMPESIAHAYGHVVDASLGNGKPASLDPQSPVGKFVAQLRASAGVATLGNKIGPDQANEGRRFWMNPSEVFARFFEQWVDQAVSQAGEAADHHAYVRGTDQPGQLAEEEIARFSKQFRTLLGSRDRSGALRITKRTPESQKSTRARQLPGNSNMRGHLTETAKGDQTDVGKRVIAGLAHGIDPKHLERAPKHYSPEMAAAHAGLVERARKKAGNG